MRQAESEVFCFLILLGAKGWSMNSKSSRSLLILGSLARSPSSVQEELEGEEKALFSEEELVLLVIWESWVDSS